LKSVIFDGNAPVVGKIVFNHVKQGCTAYVRKDSSGWNVPIPGVWNGINIEFRAADQPISASSSHASGWRAASRCLSSVILSMARAIRLNRV
jgi:hypothetical protein